MQYRENSAKASSQIPDHSEPQLPLLDVCQVKIMEFGCRAATGS